MNVKHIGIFGKVFIYTVLLLAVVIGGMFLFFSDRIKSALNIMVQQQMSVAFDPLLEQLKNKSEDQLVELAERFHEQNKLFEFSLEDAYGNVLFRTENYIPLQLDDYTAQNSNIAIRRDMLASQHHSMLFLENEAMRRTDFSAFSANGYRLYITAPISEVSVYSELFGRTIWMLVLIFVAIIVMSAIFASGIARPIKKIAADIRRMSRLEPVAPPSKRSDEIGQLASDVYAMYGELKHTIQQLEIEIHREKQMEENQRYFFSAASHELKTPIAATKAILEGMLINVIEQEEYPQYLRKCMRLMTDQNKLVTEILDIVKLNDDTVKQDKRKVNLKEVMKDILDPYVPLIEGKSQVLEVDIDENINCLLDAKLLGKALSNVILNATQNSPENAEIKIFTSTNDGHIKLCIWNSGAKIPDAIATKLYEPFYRTDEARSLDDGRTGLGLTIVKKTLDLMEIPYSLESSEKGVMFIILLI